MRKRNYQIKPQSEKEIKKARTNILPELTREEESQIISVNSSSILGIDCCEEELKDMKSEEYKNRKLREKVNEDHILYVMGLSAKQTESEADKQPQKKSPSYREIALRTVFEGGKISKDQGKLYQHYLFYLKRRNRTAIPNEETAKTLRNKIELFESVIAMLDNDHKKSALDELSILKARIDKFQ